MVGSGDVITSIKIFGDWKSTAVAEGYFEEATEMIRKMSNQILSSQKQQITRCCIYKTKVYIY